MEGIQWQSNKVYYKVSDYATREDMFDDLFEFASYLMSHSMWVVCYALLGDTNVYVVEYASQDQMINRHIPVWMTPEEVDVALKALNPAMGTDNDDDANKA